MSHSTTSFSRRDDLKRFFAVILGIALAGCAATNPNAYPTTPVLSGDALSIPPIGKTMPIAVFVRDSYVPLSVKRETVYGITDANLVVAAMKLEDAADSAGGIDKLLAVLSNETEMEHIGKQAGVGFKRPTSVGTAIGCVPGLVLVGVGAEGASRPSSNAYDTRAGLMIMAGGVALCAAGTAIGAAVGLVGALGEATYYSASGEARRMGMLEDVALPDDKDTTPLQGYVFLPPDKYKFVRLTVEDAPTKHLQTIDVPVVVGKLPGPGQTPVKIP